ncbi:MAG: YfhO family protein [Lactobacillus sp.]|jgi:hypothetical protein|nr:YfhO family protein [Lactobacillus sp.]
MNYLKSHTKPIAWLTLIIAVALSPLFMNHLYGSFDLTFHMARISTLAQNLQAGHFPNGIHNAYLSGLGYGIGFFYGNFFLYPLAGLVSLGLPVYTVIRLFLALIIVSAILSMAYVAQQICHNPRASLLAAGLYGLTNYVLFAVYARGALGESLALIWVPWILLGLYQLIFQAKTKWWLLAFSFSALLVSHIISFMLMLGLALVLTILNLKRLTQDKRWLALLKAAGLALGLTAAFWGPFVQQYAAQAFNDTAYNPKTGWPLIITTGLQALGELNPLSMNSFGYVGPFLILVPLVSLGYHLLFNRRRLTGNPFLTQLFWLAALAALVVVSQSALNLTLKLLPGLRVIQVIWRFNIFIVPILVLISANVLAQLVTHFKAPKVSQRLMGVILLLLVANAAIPLQQTHAFLRDQSKHLTQSQATNWYTVSQGEYLPVNFKKYHDPNTVNQWALSSQQAGVRLISNNPNQTTLATTAKAAGKPITIPKTYYRGYQYKLYQKNQLIKAGPVTLNYDGLGKVTLPPNFKGRIQVTYHSTTLAKIAGAISLLTWLGLGLFTLRRWRQRKPSHSA